MAVPERAEYEKPNLTEAELDALHSVNVEIHGGSHGHKIMIEGFGTACLGVTDDDYKGLDPLVDKLVPGRDVLAYEDAWHNPAQDEAWHAKIYEKVVEKSPLLHADSTDLDAFAREGRAGLIVDPHSYAVIRATAKGVRAEFADATVADLQQLPRIRKEYYGDAIDRIPIGFYEASCFRDGRMVKRLGTIATTMDTNMARRDRPTLAMVVGLTHMQPVKLLSPRTLFWRPKLYEYGRSHQEIDRKNREVGIGRIEEYEREYWLENAKRVLAERQK